MTPKNSPLRDRKYLDHLRIQRCIITGLAPTQPDRAVDAMHIGTAGTGLKAGDDEALPVSHNLHRIAHTSGEMTMFRQYLPNVILREALRAYARELYREWKRRTSGRDALDGRIARE